MSSLHQWSLRPHLHHLEHHQLLHPDLEAERGNDITVIIFKFEMTITDEKGDIQSYVHQHPHLFQPVNQRHQLQHRGHHLQA